MLIFVFVLSLKKIKITFAAVRENRCDFEECRKHFKTKKS